MLLFNAYRDIKLDSNPNIGAYLTCHYLDTYVCAATKLPQFLFRLRKLLRMHGYRHFTLLIFHQFILSLFLSFHF